MNEFVFLSRQWIWISSFKYIPVVRIEKQICSLVFWEKLRLDNFVSRSTDLGLQIELHCYEQLSIPPNKLPWSEGLCLENCCCSGRCLAKSWSKVGLCLENCCCCCWGCLEKDWSEFTSGTGLWTVGGLLDWNLLPKGAGSIGISSTTQMIMIRVFQQNL